MNIYFSIYKSLKQIEEYYQSQGISVHPSGWKQHIDAIYSAIRCYGRTQDLYIVHDVNDADIEFCVSQPPFKMLPDIVPNCYYTMVETTGLNPLWIDCLNQWNLCLNPSLWGTHCFRELLSCSVNHIGFIHDIDRFPFIERKKGDMWHYLTMGLGIADRKNLNMVMDLFLHRKFPLDSHLTVKVVPKMKSESLYQALTNQIDILNAYIPFNNLLELYGFSHVSVNPSRGEGIGLIATEAGLTGMCTIVSNFSAFAEMPHVLKIDGQVVETPYGNLGGYDFEPDIDSLYQKMIWTYEHQDESVEMGKQLSKSLQEQCSPVRFIERLNSSLMQLVKIYKRKALLPPLINFSPDWLRYCS